MARLPGMVQGVVVQITMKVPAPVLGRRVDHQGNFT